MSTLLVFKCLRKSWGGSEWEINVATLTVNDFETTCWVDEVADIWRKHYVLLRNWVRVCLMLSVIYIALQNCCSVINIVTEFTSSLNISLYLSQPAALVKKLFLCTLVVVERLVLCPCGEAGSMSLWRGWFPVIVKRLVSCHCGEAGFLPLWRGWFPVVVMRLGPCHCEEAGSLPSWIGWVPVILWLLFQIFIYYYKALDVCGAL